MEVFCGVFGSGVVWGSISKDQTNTHTSQESIQDSTGGGGVT